MMANERRRRKKKKKEVKTLICKQRRPCPKMLSFARSSSSSVENQINGECKDKKTHKKRHTHARMRIKKTKKKKGSMASESGCCFVFLFSFFIVLWNRLRRARAAAFLLPLSFPLSSFSSAFFGSPISRRFQMPT